MSDCIDECQINLSLFQLVLYYSKRSEKWIRCEIDEIKDKDPEKPGFERIAVMWAIDYGVPLSTSNLNNLVRLPHRFSENTNLVFCAGLPVNADNLREFP